MGRKFCGWFVRYLILSASVCASDFFDVTSGLWCFECVADSVAVDWACGDEEVEQAVGLPCHD